MDNLLAPYAGESVLVTGAAGGIGSNLCRRLAQLGAQVLALDDLSAGARWNIPSDSHVSFVEGDLLHEPTLKRVFSLRPQYVFHLAAFFANQNSIEHPERDLMVNGLGTLRLLEHARLCGVDRFVYASSGSIYGSSASLPLCESSVSLYLRSPYQVTKMLGELYCNFFYRHYGLRVVKGRFFGSYGPGDIPGRYRNIIPNFIFWALKGRPLPITGTGNETRDFTYVEDIVEGLIRAAISEKAVGQELNLASGKETPISDLAEMINRLAGNDAGVWRVQRRKWDDRTRCAVSIDRARSLIGYRPQTALEVGLKRTVEWFREHWKEIESSARFDLEASAELQPLGETQDSTAATSGVLPGVIGAHFDD